MKIQIDTDTIENLLKALKLPARPPRYHWAEKKFRESLKTGWVFSSDIEDILVAIDNRLCSYAFRIREICELFDIRFEEIFYRPRVISNGVISHEGLRSENFVLLLIFLERMGFQMDPSSFVDLLLPGILPRNRKLFSIAELEIFWFKKSRHKKEDVILYTEKSQLYNDSNYKLNLANGYRLSVVLEEEKPQVLRIRASKYRERPRLHSKTCPDCGYEWEQGDRESSMLHRKEHRLRMSWLDPKPHPKMTAEISAVGKASELVSMDSPQWKHLEMYNRALAFKRELHYDFTQWAVPGTEEDPDVQGYLFTNDNIEIIGACAFRNRSENPSEIKWGLQWIWICPRERRNGHLVSRWDYFRKKFGDFRVEHPVSEAMQAFLLKNGDSDLMY